MLKSVKIFLLAGLTLFFAVSLLNAQGTDDKKKDEEIKAAADPIISNILAGLAEGDYIKYSRDFSNKLKRSVSEAGFKEISSQIKAGVGICLVCDYLGALKKGKSISVFYKGMFEKSKQDILIRLKLLKEKEEYRVAGLSLE